MKLIKVLHYFPAHFEIQFGWFFVLRTLNAFFVFCFFFYLKKKNNKHFLISFDTFNPKCILKIQHVHYFLTYSSPNYIRQFHSFPSDNVYWVFVRICFYIMNHEQMIILFAFSKFSRFSIFKSAFFTINPSFVCVFLCSLNFRGSFPSNFLRFGVSAQCSVVIFSSSSNRFFCSILAV